MTRTPGRKSGATAIATRKAQRSIPTPASCGSSSTVHRRRRLNRVLAGGNYGWPLKSYGCPVRFTCRRGLPYWWRHARPGLHRAGEPLGADLDRAVRAHVLHRQPVPEWRGNAFIGALAGTALWRVALSGNQEVSRERLFADLGERIRCVRQGPDGWIYLLTGSGKLMRIER